MARVVLVVDCHVFVPVPTKLTALLWPLLDAFHLIIVDVFLLLAVHRHLAIDWSLLRFVRHHTVLVAADLAVSLLLVAHAARHLVMVRLVYDRVVVRLTLTLVEISLSLGIHSLVYVD